MTVCSAPPRSLTPSTTRRSVPMPSMRAPILPSIRHRSCTWGSRAALKISVRPSARTAASRMFSVPVTVGRSNTMRFPRSRSTSATISVCVSSIFAPICRRPRRCCSNRLAPMSSPPGRGTRALPNRPSSAPRRTIVARMRRPRSSGTWLSWARPVLMINEPSPSTRPPRPVRISPMSAVSVTRGTLLSRTGSVVRRAAAISGRAAFLEPPTQMSPASWAPPVIRSTWSYRGVGAFIDAYGTARVRLTATCSRESQTCLRHRQRLLKLSLFCRRQRSRQTLLSAAPRLLGALYRDLVGVLSDIGQHRDTIWQNFEKASPNEEDLLRPAVYLLDPQRSWLEDGHERGMTREDAKLSVRALGDDELDVAFEKAPFDAHHTERVLHCGDDFFFISSPWARASSIVPTM